MMVFDANEFATAWLSVALASSTDADRAQLNRTVLVESFPNGVQLVATDSYVLLTAWVPSEGHGLDAAPSLDEAPDAVAIAIDKDGRGKGLLRHARKLAAQAIDRGDIPPEFRLDLGVKFTEHDEQSFVGMETTWAVLEIPDVEWVKLQLYDGVYPNWRKVVAGFTPKKASLITLSPEIVGRLAKLGDLHPLGLLGWEFGGSDEMARFRVVNSEPHVDGVVMPVRWDMELNAPAPVDGDES